MGSAGRDLRAHIQVYEARTKRPILAYPLIGNGPGRVIPGGAIVTITANTDPVTENHPPGSVVRTATVHLDGIPYEAEVSPDQFTPYP